MLGGFREFPPAPVDPSLLLAASIGKSNKGEKIMATMFVRHTVSDHKAWRKTYDGFAPNLPKMGVTGQAVYQSADNPNDITVTHEFASVAAAQAFATNPDLKKAMQAGGVVGAPTIWFTTKA